MDVATKLENKVKKITWPLSRFLDMWSRALLFSSRRRKTMLVEAQDTKGIN